MTPESLLTKDVSRTSFSEAEGLFCVLEVLLITKIFL